MPAPRAIPTDPQHWLRVLQAAERLFGLLPGSQAQHMKTLWLEFEAADTADARFAKAIDRFQAPVGNLATGGGSWTDYNVTYAQIEQRVGTPIQRGAPGLWAWLQPQLDAFFAATTNS